MVDEKNLAASPIADQDLEQVTGGQAWIHFLSNDTYYVWTGSGWARNNRYLCPNCKRPVHYGAWLRFYCDPCNASWYYAEDLLPDLSTGKWEQVTKAQYEHHENMTAADDL